MYIMRLEKGTMVTKKVVIWVEITRMGI